MHNLFNATIKIPCRIEKNGTITPFQERYTIEFDRIYELPPINTTEYSEMITQLFNPMPEPETSVETSPDSSQENYPDSSDEAPTEIAPSIEKTITLSKEEITKPRRKPSLNISFKRRKNRSSHNFSVKRQASSIN
jgi:hypothetical protein